MWAALRRNSAVGLRWKSSRRNNRRRSERERTLQTRVGAFQSGDDLGIETVAGLCLEETQNSLAAEGRRTQRVGQRQRRHANTPAVLRGRRIADSQGRVRQVEHLLKELRALFFHADGALDADRDGGSDGVGQLEVFLRKGRLPRSPIEVQDA